MRKKYNYPPYSYFYEITLVAKDKKILREKVNEMIEFLKKTDTQGVLNIIDYTYEEKIRKVRGENKYTHKSWVKLKDYNSFFDFLKDYSQKNKFILDIIEK
jgi:primosomal protein N'